MTPLHFAAPGFCHTQDHLPPESIVFGRSAHMQALRSRVQRTAGLDIPVLIKGESGTGKEIIARMLHQQAPWNSGLFVKVTCSCIPETFDELLESSAGTVTHGDGFAPPEPKPVCDGTLFLDEVSETNASLQSKLLRLLQENQFCNVNLKRCKLILRLVCATNCGLEGAAERGKFRRDLLYRINVLTMRVPALRERSIDIPDLVNYFLALSASANECKVKPLSKATLQSLIGYSWPGNIRELENLMKCYVLFGCEDSIFNEVVGHTRKQTTLESPLPRAISLKDITRSAVRELERDAILKALQANQWNRKRTACVLNISYRALLYKLKDAGITGESGIEQLAQEAPCKAIG